MVRGLESLSFDENPLSFDENQLSFDENRLSFSASFQVQVDASERAVGLREGLALAKDESRSVSGQTRGRLLPQQRREVSEDAQTSQVGQRRFRPTLRIPAKGDGRRSEEQTGEKRRRRRPSRRTAAAPDRQEEQKGQERVSGVFRGGRCSEPKEDQEVVGGQFRGFAGEAGQNPKLRPA